MSSEKPSEKPNEKISTPFLSDNWISIFSSNKKNIEDKISLLNKVDILNQETQDKSVSPRKSLSSSST